MKKLSMEELHRVDVDTYKQSEKNPVVIVLDNIRSMNNIGSVFRTADAFKIEKIILCGITATPPHKDIEKTALGATLSVNWEYASDTLQAVQQLQLQGYTAYAIEQVEHSIPLHMVQWDTHTPVALVLGNEVMGVDQKVVDHCSNAIEIPQFGTKHSLNISVSAGIVMWHFCQLALHKQ